MSEADLQRELAEARATVATQAMQINQLLRESEGQNAVSALREMIALSEVIAATLGTTQYRALLSGIVEAARRLFDAGAASVLTLDHEADELVFEAAREASMIGVRIPTHQGIAGWVVMTGEPIAVADVHRDPRFSADFAQSTGYVPRSIMAAPLLVGEDVEGVIEVLDKKNSNSFGLEDMELLGLFAGPAAIALEQARAVAGVGRMLVSELASATEGAPDAVAILAQQVQREDSNATQDVLELARLVHHVGRRGERARRIAFDVLSSVARNS